MSSMLSLGDAAPLITAPLHDGSSFALEDFAGKTVVLYFYPKDDTPGCTIEAKDFRDLHEEFTKAGAIIVGVSKDSLKKHCAFIDKYGLTFPLISDEDGSVCEAFGTWVEKSMYGKTYMGIDRATFVIDGKGILRQIWRKVKVTDHAKEVLAFVQTLS